METHRNYNYSPLSDSTATHHGLQADGQESDLHTVSEHAGTFQRKYSNYDMKNAAHGRSAVMRVKKSRVMRWLVLHNDGERQTLNLEKRQIIQGFNLDIPIRDMRLLDPAMSNYETIGQILTRENVIVLSMEHVKAIIMADKVIIPIEDDKNEVKERFILYLEQMIQEYAAHASAQAEALERSAAENEFLFPGSGLDLSQRFQQGPSNKSASMFGSVVGGGGSSSTWLQGGPVSGGGAFHAEDEILPFELHVLEVALGEICNHLAREENMLKAQAQPALDDLTNNADQPTLERVRKIKTGLQRMVGRAKVVREVLERLMQDDDDMLRMCLSKQVQKRSMSPSGSVAIPTGLGPGNNSTHSPLMVPGSSPALMDDPLTPPKRTDSLLASNIRRHQADQYDEMNQKLMDVENLIESYFALIDSTLQSLVALGEYIDDTEDLINIQLDYSRNKLIRFEIMLTTGTFSLAMFSAVAGMLGENVILPDSIREKSWSFTAINVAVLLACFTVFWSIVGVLIKRKLI